MHIPTIQWFPGHMTRTKRIMEKDVKIVDIIIEVLDSRIPYSSSNPLLNEIVKNKPKIMILNKADISDPNKNIVWKNHFTNLGYHVISMNSKKSEGTFELRSLIDIVMADKVKRWNERGMTGKKTRAMIVGVTNVGKSTLINSLAGSKKTKVADRPGVTRGRQWVNAGRSLEILDTPGVLWPKFEDKVTGELLAFTGAVKDDVLDIEYLAMRLINYLLRLYPKMFVQRYNLDKLDSELFSSLNEFEILEVIGKNRGMLLPKNEIDTKRAAVMLFDEFRAGIIGKITLETPEDIRESI